MSNNNVKVSVIMSVYNGERYLKESLESILTQTFTNFEFIIINDGSTDKTGAILHAIKEPRMCVYHQENQGLTKSLNRALSYSQGEYIARQDADDVSYPERLREEVTFLDERKHVGMVGTYANFINREGKIFYTWKPPVSHENILEVLHNDGNSFCHGSIMMRKEILDNVGVYREKFTYSQDYDLWLRFSHKYELANIPKVLYNFRRNSSSISRKNIIKQLLFHLLAIELSKERREKGFDSIDSINTNNLEAELMSKFGKGKEELLLLKTKFLERFLSESLEAKDYLSSIKIWCEFFKVKPEKWKIKDYIKKLVKSL